MVNIGLFALLFFLNHQMRETAENGVMVARGPRIDRKIALAGGEIASAALGVPLSLIKCANRGKRGHFARKPAIRPGGATSLPHL
jgi:hypothetical protein